MVTTALYIILASLTQAALAASTGTQRCLATAYFHKQVAYDSGIYFQHGDVYHEGIYGSFWDGVNETATRNVGLKRFTFGYDKDMVGYLWGNSIEYGYVGGGKGYLLGLQAAVGSLAGLLTSATEEAFDASYAGDTVKSWNQSSVYPVIGSPNGASAATAMQSVLNRTAIEQSLVGVTAENDDDRPNLSGVLQTAIDSAVPVRQTRSLSWDDENNEDLHPRSDEEDLQSCESDDMSNEKDEDEDEEGCEEDSESTKGNGKLKHGPELCSVYHAPWKTSKPVYFHGRCDNCDVKTGFNKNGHGSFQACSLIYHGKEYFGKPDETKERYTCVVKFDC
jgi:hypothetical protein